MGSLKSIHPSSTAYPRLGCGSLPRHFFQLLQGIPKRFQASSETKSPHRILGLPRGLLPKVILIPATSHSAANLPSAH